MKIEKLRISGFRNIDELEVQPGSKLNFISGSNGQGKTSILEAIGFLSSLESFRSQKTNGLIKTGYVHSSLEAGLAYNEWKIGFAARLTKTEASDPRKLAFINGKLIGSHLEYLKKRLVQPGTGFHAISFNPCDHDLVTGDPKNRRRYLDKVLSSEDHLYLDSLKRYKRALSQRNLLLKQGSFSLLQPFTRQLLDEGAYLVLARLFWFERLFPKLNYALREITSDGLFLGLQYMASCAPRNSTFVLENMELTGGHFSLQGSMLSLEVIKEAFSERLVQLAPIERQVGTTLCGPHRDDWGFLLRQMPLKNFGSQGEIRAALLALKLAEYNLFRESLGVQPVFLLDDFSSELDAHRRGLLIRLLMDSGIQAFVTSTEELKAEGQHYRIENGVLK